MMMKNLIRFVAVFVVAMTFLPSRGAGQFKSEIENPPSSSQGLLKPNASMGNFLGILNADNFAMHHSFSVNYLSSGEGGLSLASYTNSMFYKIADPLNVRFDVTLMGSPYGSYAGYQQTDFSKVFISRAELNYKPWENTSIKVEYNQLPFNRYYYYDRFSPSPFLMGDQ